MNWLGWVAIGVAALFALGWPIAAHNTLVTMQSTTWDALRGIDIELTRRWELVPRLADVARSYAEHEATVLERVAMRRASTHLDGDPRGALKEVGDHVIAEETRSEAELGAALSGLRALAEAHPDLRSSQHYAQLIMQLRDTEDRIAAARRLYNGNVSRFNAKLKSFPAVLLGRWAGMTPAEFWVIADDSHAAPPPLTVRTGTTDARPPVTEFLSQTIRFDGE